MIYFDFHDSVIIAQGGHTCCAKEPKLEEAQRNTPLRPVDILPRKLIAKTFL